MNLLIATASVSLTLLLTSCSERGPDKTGNGDSQPVRLAVKAPKEPGVSPVKRNETRLRAMQADQVAPPQTTPGRERRKTSRESATTSASSEQTTSSAAAGSEVSTATEARGASLSAPAAFQDARNALHARLMDAELDNAGRFSPEVRAELETRAKQVISTAREAGINPASPINERLEDKLSLINAAAQTTSTGEYRRLLMELRKAPDAK